MSHPKKRQIRSLIGLRFFAALSVVTFHFAHPTSELLSRLNSNGCVGVTLFFVLSGFILGYTYISSDIRFTGTKREFWVARFARIYPMYAIGLALAAPMVLVWGPVSEAIKGVTGIAAILLLQTWLQPLIPSWNDWNGPGWSLSAEAIFYLMFPFIVPLISKLRSHLKIAIPFFWALSVAPIALELVNHNVDLLFWYHNPLARLPEFIIGIIASVQWSFGKNSSFGKFAGPLSILSLAGLIALMMTPVSPEYLKNGTCVPLILTLILSLAYERGPLDAFLSTEIVVKLGASSYSLYILHWPLWEITQYAVKKSGLERNIGSGLFFLYLTILIGAAYLFFKYFEEPCSRILKRKLNAKKSSNAHHHNQTAIEPKLDVAVIGS